MFDLIFLFGPAALTYLIIYKCKGMVSEPWHMVAVKLLAYGLIDLSVLIIVLKMVDKIKIVYLADGSTTIQYGMTAIITAVVVAAFVGFVLSAMDVDAETRKKENDNVK